MPHVLNLILLDLLNVKDMGYKCHLAAIAVVLALEEHQDAIANNFRVRGCPCKYNVHAVWVYWCTPR